MPSTSTSRRRGSKHQHHEDDNNTSSRSNHRRSSSRSHDNKRRGSAAAVAAAVAPGAVVISHGATTTAATATLRRRRGSSGSGDGAGLLASTSKPSSSSTSYASMASRAVASGGSGGGGGGGRRDRDTTDTNSGEHSHTIIRDAVRAHAPKEEGGFLNVDEYVIHLYDKYGQGGGVLSRKTFAQAMAETLGDERMTSTELDHAFEWFQKASGVQEGISVDAFLEGCLMSDEERRETAGKLRAKIKKKFGKRDDQLRELFHFMAEPNRGDSASARVLCEVVDEWLKVDIAEPEAISLLQMMDLDRDGAVSVDDFMGFVGPQGEEIVEATSLAARLGSAIVDIEVSTSKEQELELEQNGYKVVDANVNAGTFGPPIHVWYRRLKHGGAGMRLKPLVDVVIDHKNVNSALVVDGYQCIDRSLSKGTPLGASNYLWVRRAMTEEEEARDAIVDLAVTTGKAKDRTSDIHTPPARQDQITLKFICISSK
ncbi:unnamed protein product [Pylaiella littoralis]